MAATAPNTLTAAASLPKVRVARDGRSFEASGGRPFVPFGVNYYRPGTGWAPQIWKTFDPDAVRRDLELLRRYGGNCVRVFLTYGSIYPEPGTLSQEGIAKLDRFIEIADKAGVYVHPTGPDHWEGTPQWATGDRFSDEQMLRAQEQFWTLLASRYRGVATVFAYDLLNEPTVRWSGASMQEAWTRWVRAHYDTPAEAARAWGIPEADIDWQSPVAPPPIEKPYDRMLLDYQSFRESVADEWTRRQVAAIKAADPEALVTVGLIQWSVPSLLPGVDSYSGFRPERQARYLDFLEVHFYPLDDGILQYRNREEIDRNLAYLESVVREVAAPGKPTVIAEFGWYGGGSLPQGEGRRSRDGTEEDQASWCGDLVVTTAGLATGWLNWGFHDHPQARDVSILTGLFTADGREKAWARRFRELAMQHAGHRIPPRKLGPRPAMDWDLLLTSPSASKRFRDEYYQAFMRDRGAPTPA